MWNFILGYVIIDVYGLHIEDFLNRLEQSGCALLGVKRKGYARLTLTARRDKHIIAMAQERGLEARVVSRRGSAAIGGFIRRRPALIAGAAAAAVMLLIISSFCLDVEFCGLETVREYSALGIVREAGVVTPMLRSDIDAELIKNNLREAFPQIEYVDVKLKGVVLEVIISEGALPPALADDTPSSLVAAKDAVVCEVRTLAGMQMVFPGDAVSEGDILISGDYIAAEKPIITAAKGEVLAQTVYEASAQIAFDATELVPTGRTAKGRMMRLGNRTILLEGKNPFKVYTEKHKTAASLGENAPLHLEIIDIEWCEAVRETTPAKAEAAVLAAKEKAYYAALAQIPEGAQIISYKAHVMPGEKITLATAVIITCEDIAERKSLDEIVGNTDDD